MNSSVVSKGEEIVLPYYSEGTEDIDVIVAVGTRQGMGPGSYSLLSTEGIQVVEFVTSKPDSSSLKNGQLYIWTNPADNYNYRIYLSGSERVIEKIGKDLFVSDKNGDKYYVSGRAIRKFSDLIVTQDLKDHKSIKFVTRAEYNELPESDKSEESNVFFICERA